MENINISDFTIFLNDSKVVPSEANGITLNWSENHFDLVFDFTKLPKVQSIKLNISNRPCYMTIDKQESDYRVGWKPMKPFIRAGFKTVFLSDTPQVAFDSMSTERLKIVKLSGRVGYFDTEDSINVIMSLKHHHDRLIRENESTVKRYHDRLIEVANKDSKKTKKDAKNNLTIKQKLKNTAKTILGRNVDIPRDSAGNPLICYDQVPIGSVDCFVYMNDVLHSYGWIHDNESPIKNLFITYYYSGELVASHSCDQQFRKDVAEVINIPEAINSGFTFESFVESEFPLQVYAEYTTDKGRGVMFLGDIPSKENVSGTTVKIPDDPRNMGCITDFMDVNTVDYLINDERIYIPAVDIIMPVYNAFEYFDLLFESLNKTKINYKLIMINDCSPDERVLPYLKKYAESHDNTVLLSNEENLGFVRTVNKGLEIAIKDNAHAVLLNTDVEVTDEWLERLIAPVILGENVATATPFTNAGTVCSFPNFCKDNKLFEGMLPWQIDNAFRFVKPLYPEMPSGVGFCMAMNIEAIKKVGLLDAETFGKGYGEENDWCQRAILAGFKNVHVDNLFVYHKHGGSFPSEEKKRLNDENSAKLFARYPNYKKEVGAYCATDPVKTRRLYVQLRLLGLVSAKKTTLAFDHGIGGGATSYLEKKCKEKLANDEKFIIIRYIGASKEYKMICMFRKNRVELSDERLENLLDIINSVDEIWINELVTYPRLEETLKIIKRFNKRVCARLCFKLHDFFCICPAVTLVDENFKYCDIADSDRCDICVKTNENALMGGFENVADFRKAWEEFLLSCDEITAFSESSKEILKRAYPSINEIEVVPHTTTALKKPHRKRKKTDTFNIGILGAINENKGRLIIDDCVSEIEKTGRKAHIVIIGYANKKYDSEAITVTGKYKRAEVAKLVEKNDIDVFIIPSIWPETFSYTSSEIMSMKVPLAVFDIGAPPERVKDYEMGLIIPKYEGAKKLIDTLEELGAKHKWSN